MIKNLQFDLLVERDFSFAPFGHEKNRASLGEVSQKRGLSRIHVEDNDYVHHRQTNSHLKRRTCINDCGMNVASNSDYSTKWPLLNRFFV